LKRKILICTDWFTPAFRAGGPIRSVENLVRLLSADLDIYIFTGDRDLNDTEGFAGIPLDNWNEYAQGIHVYYATPVNQTRAGFRKIIKDVNPDVLYINSLFSKNFAIRPLMISRSFGNLKTVVSPRGMLRGSALSFKPLKKKFFLSYARLISLFSHVHFHATDELEVTDIQKQISKTIPVSCIGNVPAAPDAKVEWIEKRQNTLNLIFVGRIHPIKNLHLLLEALKKVKSKVQCTLVGVMEDADYWNRCKEIIGKLPQNIAVTEPVEITPETVAVNIRKNHLFVLPTQGENFGHAIFEALCCGRPVLISDQTPWQNLEGQRAGWDVSLNLPDVLSEKIECVAAMNREEWQDWCTGAHRLAQTIFNDESVRQKYLQLFS
jgi:glycosyltransferase involved in cell wall biosynthesis